MKSTAQASQVNVVADRNAGQQPVAGWRQNGMCIDVDDDQVGRSRGYTNPELRMGTPPVREALQIDGGCMEAMTPTTR